MMNNKGQIVVLGIMMFVFVLVIVMNLIQPLKDTISDSRDRMGCQYDNLTTWQAGTCVVIDITLFYFVGAALIAGSIYLWFKQ